MMKTALLPFIDNHSTILILGTMPGEESLRLQQYYGNRGNRFWKLLFTVFDEPFTTDYTKRIELLQSKNIAIWDVLAYCERDGSLDSKIKNEIPNNFEVFFSTYPKIKTVFFSSKNAAKFYEKYAIRQSGIHYHILPSPSGANATKSFDQKLEEWKILNNFI